MIWGTHTYWEMPFLSEVSFGSGDGFGRSNGGGSNDQVNGPRRVNEELNRNLGLVLSSRISTILFKF